MKNWKISLSALLLLSTLWIACRDQDTPGSAPKIDVVFAGRIIDEDGQSVENARVQAGAEVAHTDANGVFQLDAAHLPGDDAKITVTKTGYFDFSRAYYAEDGALLNVTIQLLRRELAGSFSAGAGGTVQVPGGASLVFPVGAVNHSGNVNVFARYLDPTDPDLSLHMPGDLRAVSAAGEEQTLATFGMLAVELTNGAGQELQIAAGKEVEITMPIPAAQLSVAPDEIPLWHYDLDKARWIEEGKAQRMGNQYVGKVKHFSYWNCDIPLPLVQVSGKVYVDNAQTPAVNAHIVFSYAQYAGKCHGWTDENGCFTGSIPKDVVLDMDIYFGDCNTPVYSTQAGPFSNDVVLPDVVINSSALQIVTLNGRVVDCNNAAAANSYATIKMGAWLQVVFADQNGEFTFTIQNCNATATATVTCFDVVNLNSSAPQTVSLANSPVSLGDVPTCQALGYYIQYTLDGQTFLISDPSGEYFAPLTYLTSQDSIINNVDIYINFENNAQTGTFPLKTLYMNGLETSHAEAANVTTNVTSFGNVGAPIIGNFSGNFVAHNGTSHSISGTYRVLRSQ